MHASPRGSPSFVKVPWSRTRHRCRLRCSRSTPRRSCPRRSCHSEESNRSVCPRLFESKSCTTTNCSCLHPDFLNEHWVVPDIICHKWFQGCCDPGDRCWNQHGFTFDAALRQALRVQNQLRGDEPPCNHSSEGGGVIRQVSREQARAWIQKSTAHFRRTQIRK